jgi:hypothetical protein
VSELSARTMDLLQEIRRRVDADFAESSPGYSGLTFMTYAAWVANSAPGGLAGTSPVHPGEAPPVHHDSDDDPVCVAGGHSFPVSLRSGIAEAVVAVASALQDDAMDHLNRPWPELVSPAVVLQPRIDERGEAVWASDDGSVRCPVGQLQSTFGVPGLLK